MKRRKGSLDKLSKAKIRIPAKRGLRLGPEFYRRKVSEPPWNPVLTMRNGDYLFYTGLCVGKSKWFTDKKSPHLKALRPIGNVVLCG